MMNPDSCYYELSTKSINLTKLFNTSFDKLSWSQYHNFTVGGIDLDVINSEPALQAIAKEFPIAKMGILKLDPYHFYNWHVDGVRGVAINMLVTPDVESYCLFRDEHPENKSQFEVLKLDYKPNTFYVFNTQWQHSVLNLAKPRYLFSVEFEQDKHNLNYDTVKQWAVKYSL